MPNLKIADSTDHPFVDGAIDEMRGLEFDTLCNAFLSHIEARPDADPDTLMELANKLGRIAWRGIKP